MSPVISGWFCRKPGLGLKLTCGQTGVVGQRQRQRQERAQAEHFILHSLSCADGCPPRTRRHTAHRPTSRTPQTASSHLGPNLQEQNTGKRRRSDPDDARAKLTWNQVQQEPHVLVFQSREVSPCVGRVQGPPRCCEHHFTGFLHAHVGAGAGAGAGAGEAAAWLEVGSVRGRALFGELGRLQRDGPEGKAERFRRRAGLGGLTDSHGRGSAPARSRTARPAPGAVSPSGPLQPHIRGGRFLCCCRHTGQCSGPSC